MKMLEGRDTKKQHDCIMRNFTVCTVHQILGEWSNYKDGVGRTCRLMVQMQTACKILV